MTTPRTHHFTGPAPWLEKERAQILRRAGRDSNRMRSALKECGVVLSGGTSEVPTHIGDILEVLRQLKLSVDWLVQRRRKPTRGFARAILAQIRNDIYIDLEVHARLLAGALDQVIEDLDHRLVHKRKDRPVRRPRGKPDRKRESFTSILAWSAKGR